MTAVSVSPASRVAATLLTTLQTYVVLGGLVSFVGWAANVPRLTDWDNSGISIQPNTTIAVTSAGIALFLLGRGFQRAATAMGVWIALIGFSVHLQNFTGLDFGTDTLLMFDRPWGRRGVLVPGRMGPAGATSWTLIGIAFVLASRRRPSRARRWAPRLALVTASISTLGLIGHLYGASTLYTLPHSTVIALQTASFILAVSLGLLIIVREHGPMRLLTDRSAGGVLARRILPAIILVPILMGSVRVGGERAGLFDSAFGSAVRTLAEILLFSLLLGWTANAVGRHARRRAEAQRASRASRQRVIETMQALERSRKQLEAELGDTRLLQSISTELVLQDDPRSFYESILDTATRIMHSDFGSMQMVSPERNGELYLLAHRGFSEEARKAWEWVRLDSHSACGAALKRGTRVVVPDIALCPDLGGAEYAALFESLGIVAMQSTPLVSRAGVTLGMLSTHWRQAQKPLERELGLLDILARQAADWMERRQSERQREELLQKERTARSDAERAARLKDEFLATLSHELRTPLNAVIGWSQLLKRDPTNRERVRAAVDVIERNGRLQAKLITDLLDISRIISGNMRLDVQAVELSQVIDAAIDSILPAAEAKGLRIQRLAEPLPAPITGDPARLQQMVWNLLSNAVKFTPRGGRIQVVLARMHSRVEIRVTDSGEGIDPAFLPHVFERFRQGDASSSRHHGGLGLGLALVKQFAELHGGSVRASSDGRGKGATFAIQLPLANADKDGELARVESHPRSADPYPPAGIELGGMNVLLVDDEPDALAMVRCLLEENGAHVHTAPSSDAALELLRDRTFDVIVSDIAMPGRDGYELITELRIRGIHTPAVALTAFARSEDQAQAIRSGYQAHLSKPVEAADLLTAISRLTMAPPVPADAVVASGLEQS